MFMSYPSVPKDSLPSSITTGITNITAQILWKANASVRDTRVLLKLFLSDTFPTQTCIKLVVSFVGFTNLVGLGLCLSGEI